MEQMLGSYGVNPNGQPYVKNLEPEESPSGMLARSGTYSVRSRVVDDDGEVFAGTSPGYRLLLPAFMPPYRLGMDLQTRQGMVMRRVYSLDLRLLRS